MPIPDAALRNLWYQALEQEIGIGIKTDDRAYVVNRLYGIRQDAQDPELDRLIIMQPNGDEVWICKKNAELP